MEDVKMCARRNEHVHALLEEESERIQNDKETRKKKKT
jgi:hypothetical protein